MLSTIVSSIYQPVSEVACAVAMAAGGCAIGGTICYIRDRFGHPRLARLCGNIRY